MLGAINIQHPWRMITNDHCCIILQNKCGWKEWLTISLLELLILFINILVPSVIRWCLKVPQCPSLNTFISRSLSSTDCMTVWSGWRLGIAEVSFRLDTNAQLLTWKGNRRLSNRSGETISTHISTTEFWCNPTNYNAHFDRLTKGSPVVPLISKPPRH